MVTFTTSTEGLGADQLHGFFAGWPNPPSPEAHLRILHHSQQVVLAQDAASGELVGFITAISDGVWTAYIPLLEVKPAWRGQGIGRELLQRMLAQFRDYYMVDLLCNPEVQGFFERQGMLPATGACVRYYRNQAARPVR